MTQASAFVLIRQPYNARNGHGGTNKPLEYSLSSQSLVEYSPHKELHHAKGESSSLSEVGDGYNASKITDRMNKPAESPGASR